VTVGVGVGVDVGVLVAVGVDVSLGIAVGVLLGMRAGILLDIGMIAGLLLGICVAVSEGVGVGGGEKLNRTKLAMEPTITHVLTGEVSRCFSSRRAVTCTIAHNQVQRLPRPNMCALTMNEITANAIRNTYCHTLLRSILGDWQPVWSSPVVLGNPVTSPEELERSTEQFPAPLPNVSGSAGLSRPEVVSSSRNTNHRLPSRQAFTLPCLAQRDTVSRRTPFSSAASFVVRARPSIIEPPD
jgi:hypothetical protein